MNNYLIQIGYDWKVVVIIVRSDTRNHANKIANKWIKENHPNAVGKCTFQIHDFSYEDEGVVFNDTIYLG